MSNEFCYIEVCFLLLLLFTFLSVKIILSSSNLWVYLVSCFSVIQCPQRRDCTSLGQIMRFDCVCVHMCVCKFCDQFKCSHNCMYISYTCIYYIGRDWCEVSLVDPRSGPTLYFYSNSLMYSCLFVQWHQHTALSCTFFASSSVWRYYRISLRNSRWRIKRSFAMANDLLFVLMAKGGPHSLYESWLLASLICFSLIRARFLPSQGVEVHTQNCNRAW